MLGPDNAVNRFGGRIAYGAAREASLFVFWSALVALGESTLDQFHLAIVAGGAALDQRDIRIEAHAIYMIPGGPVVQGAEHQIELLKEVDAIISTKRYVLLARCKGKAIPTYDVTLSW